MKREKRARRRRAARFVEQVEDLEIVGAAESGAKGSRPGARRNRKAMQLCRQVADALGYVLAGGDVSAGDVSAGDVLDGDVLDGDDDELFACLRVVSVVPAPDSSRLLVTVTSDVPRERFQPQAIVAYLDRRAGILRTEVAASIHRKRAPVLLFNVVGPCAAEV